MFERFPRLKVIFVEMGWAWVGPAMWKMDRSWQSFRVQVPWCKKPPSEYVIDHVRFTTQPMDEPKERDFLLQAAQMMHAERTLLLSSDYPHWDGDDPKLSFAGFPKDLKDRIFRENAARGYAAFKVEDQVEGATRIEEFDPTAREIIQVPRIVGG